MAQRLSGSKLNDVIKQADIAKMKLSTEKRAMSPELQKEFEDMLLESAKGGKISEIKRLLNAGANINAKDKKGRTALIWTSYYGRTEACALLIEKGADVNAKGEKGYRGYGGTALLFAAKEGKTETCALLIDRGANLNARIEGGDSDGQTALVLARSNEKKETAEFLILAKVMDMDSFKKFMSLFKECTGQ